jgi:hypothetical protein
MSGNDDDKFRAIAGEYGTMEAQMGADAYQANVLQTKAQAHMIEAQAMNVDLTNKGLEKQLEGQETHDTLHGALLLKKAEMMDSFATILKVVSILLFLYGIVGLVWAIRLTWS